MTAPRHHVIVGAGTAGLSAVEAIRRASPDDAVTILSAEPDPPYSPTVLPHLLAGRIDEGRIALRPESFFVRGRCRLRLGAAVGGLDADRRRVRLADGAALGYDTLLLASGSEPLRPALDNPNAVEVLAFTRLADLRALRARLADGCRVAVLGAGLIGMELAEALVHLGRGVRVTVIEQERQVLPRSFDGRLAREIAALFESRGVALQLGRRAVALERAGAGAGAALTLSDGGAVGADLVVACVGVRPRAGFLAGAGLATARGVLVDRRMATSLPGVFAAGDVAEGPAADGTPGLNPVLPTAAGQGRVAGANMAGRSAEHEGWLPANVFNFFGRVAMSVGATEAGPGVTDFARAEGAARGRLLFAGARLVGASFVGVAADPGALGWLIREGVPARDHAELLLARPVEAARWLAARSQRAVA
ncbi:MAG: FAD-dependent oxidoreductase [Candidatus Rokubacteria bacterium]|nr:FAD-dependent oxidoreductase [Candidatus Rokubacteria bacterium]